MASTAQRGHRAPGLTGLHSLTLLQKWVQKTENPTMTGLQHVDTMVTPPVTAGTDEEELVASYWAQDGAWELGAPAALP